MSDTIYTIEKIIGRRLADDGYEYKIKWEGCPLEKSTWEPVKNLENALTLVTEYDKAHPIEINKKKEEENTANNKKIDEEENNENKNNEEIVKEKKETEPIEDNFEENSNSKILIYENEITYKVDYSLKKVIRVKKLEGKLIAVVEKIGEKGEKIEENIPTDELRKINPWILLEFYESKIKFT